MKRKKKTKEDKNVNRKPFWNTSTKEVSDRIWLPTEFTYEGLESSLLNGSLNNTRLNSWFQVLSRVNNNLDNDSSYISNLVDRLPSTLEPVKPPPKKKSRKDDNSDEDVIAITGIHSIKLKPSPEEKKKLKSWMGSFRFFYNKAVELYRNTPDKKKITIGFLRKELLNRDALDKHGWTWAKNIHYDVNDEALRDFIKALKIRKDQNQPFVMHFKTKKKKKDSIVIHKKHWEHKNGQHAFLKSINSNPPLPEALPADCRLIHEDGCYYLKLIQKNGVNTTDNQGRREVIALDPGIRTFMAGYDPQGYTFEWGYKDYKRLRRLYHATTKLESLMSKVIHKKRLRLKKVSRKIWRKIRNLVDDCHYKLIKFLTSTYKTIVIPIFKVKEMLEGTIHRKAKQSLSLWSHYRFRYRLKQRAKILEANVVVVEEDYTSRTCTKCGHNNPKSSLKTKKCQSCGFIVDRDINGARNILLKSVTK